VLLRACHAAVGPFSGGGLFVVFIVFMQ